MSIAPDRHTLYTLCAQAPLRDAKVLSAIHGKRPRILGEDFCGTAALSRAWAGLGRSHRAIGVDHDADTLAAAEPHSRVRLVCRDVRRVREPADLIAVLNYSIGEFHDRGGLVGYLRHARSRLKRRGKSACFVCDIYGGADAFLTGRVRQRFRLPTGEAVLYDWEQRTADALTGRVSNAMHFTLTPRRGRRIVLHDAFTYDWRLWSVPELRDAMREAGFGRTEAFERRPGAIDDRGDYHAVPIEDAAEIGDSFSVYVAARL